MDSPSRRILLLVASLLAALLVGNRLIGAGGDGASIDDEIASLQRKLQNVPDEAGVLELGRQVERAEQYMKLPMSARQQYLESLIGLDFISSVDPGQPAPAPRWAEKATVTFQFKLRLTLEQLTEVLARLDADPLPMRVDRLRIRPGDQVERTLQVDVSVATLADAKHSSATSPPADGAPTTREALTLRTPSTQPSARPLLNNIFFPVGLLPRAPTTLRPDTAVNPFTLVAVEHAGSPPRALLRLDEAAESIWVEPGMTVAGVTLDAIEPDGAVFSIGSQTDRLAVGYNSGRLLLGKRTFRNACRLVGVIRDPVDLVAVAKFPGRADYVYLAVGDTLHGGKVAAIDVDSVTLDYSGYDSVIEIGQDSDNPLSTGVAPE